MQDQGARIRSPGQQWLAYYYFYYYYYNKYRLLGDDKTSFAGNRLVISHTVEVSTLGLASDTKDFMSATKLPDVPNSLWHSVACQTLSPSFGINCTRNSNDDPIRVPTCPEIPEIPEKINLS